MSTILWANNATTTLAGGISNVATTAVLAAGTGVEFPSPGVGQYFTMTFNDAATGLLDEIVHVTNVSGDTITIVRAQEGTTAQSWSAGDLASNLLTAGSLAALVQQSSARIKLQAPINFFINPATGVDDAAHGLSSGTPWATRQFAYNFVQANYDAGGITGTAITFNCVGAFTDNFLAAGPIVGIQNENSVLFLGNASTPSLVTVTSTGNCFAAGAGAKFFVSGFTLSSSGGNCLISQGGGSSLIYGSCIFGSAAGAHVVSSGSGNIAPTATYTISGGAQFHWLSQNNAAIIAFQAMSIILSGTPAFSNAFAEVSDNGTINVPHTLVTFSGSGATGSRYSALSNGAIDSVGGGATFLPGSSAGTTDGHGVYN